jgi:mono/diheme cytochrome c family protein
VPKVTQIVGWRKRILVNCLACIMGLSVASHAAADPSQAERDYRANCASCHGPDGNGDGDSLPGGLKPRSWRDCRWMGLMSDATLFQSIAHGGRSVGFRDMPPFAGKLNDQQITGLVKFIRGLCPPTFSQP